MSDFIKTKDEVIKNYSSNAQIGLSDKQAKENIEKFGTNSLTKKKADSLLKRIWDASTEPMLLMLIAAGLIALAVNIIRSFTGGKADYLECVGVFAAIALSVVISVVMEGRSAKAFDALSKINSNVIVKAVRAGKTVKLNKDEIAVGDILILSAGDKIPADCRLVESTSLRVDESALTGESFPVKKDSEIEITDEKTPLAERANMIYSGTFITEGHCKAIVSSVGDSTEFGKIASELTGADNQAHRFRKSLQGSAKQSQLWVFAPPLLCLWHSLFHLLLQKV